MKAELMREVAEQTQLEQKAKALDVALVFLNNALCYLYENMISSEDVAEYIGTDIETLDAINSEDYVALSEIAD